MMCPPTIDEEPSLELVPPMSWAKSTNSQRLIFCTKPVGIEGMLSLTQSEKDLRQAVGDLEHLVEVLPEL